MKRLIYLLLCCVLAFSCAVSFAEEVPSLRQENDADITSGVYDSYFDDAVFVGDSVSRQLYTYVKAMRERNGQLLGGARFLTAGNLTLYDASFKAVHGNVRLRYRGHDVTPQDGLKEMGACKAFVLLGLNDGAGYQLEKDIKRYGALIDHILEKNPGITLICQSMSPVQKNRQTKALNQENLNAFNDALKTLCEEKGVIYLDIATPLKTEEGFLRSELALSKSDNVHLNNDGICVWIDTLRRFAREQYEQGVWTMNGESAE